MKQFIHELGPWIKSFFMVLGRKLFGKDIESIFNNTIVQVISLFIVLIGIIVIINDLINKYKHENNTNNSDNLLPVEPHPILGPSPREDNKDPMSRPECAGEETGPCPVCGYPKVVARKSRKTGELYFGCAAPKYGPKRGCNFKGCRSH